MLAIQINTTSCDGSDVFWPWILWLLAAFILGIILGWLLKQIFGSQDSTAKSTDYKDDLTKVEGIGPKIQQLLYNKGITNYYLLSNTKTEVLHDILVEAGPAFLTHKDITYNWAAQALLAEQGHWEELERWQKLLKDGV
ncbi:MAG: hypothetical protein L3J34_11865 [Flavobacteriaceae bacterium]|nr:hypothetical protein [Flavobacteriaceae bacterium]